MYHTFAQLKERISVVDLLALTDDEGAGTIVETPPNVPMTRISAAGNSAAGIIDSYCRGRYTVPLSTTPDIVKEISIELTINGLYKRRRDLVSSEEQQYRYKNTISLLNHIQEGKLKLFDEIAGPPTYVTNKDTEDTFFSSSELAGF